MLRIIEYSLDILWFISYPLCTLSSSFYILFCFLFVSFFCTYIEVSLYCVMHPFNKKKYYFLLSCHTDEALDHKLVDRFHSGFGIGYCSRVFFCWNGDASISDYYYITLLVLITVNFR